MRESRDGVYLERHRYGGGGKTHVVVLAPHAGDASTVSRARPDLLSHCHAPPELLERYIAVERDVGSAEVALAVAAALARKGLAIEVLVSKLPRALIDPGRLTARALRHVWRADADAEHLAWLVHAHASSVAEVLAAVNRLDPEEGIFLDIHSMAPRNPTRMVSATSAAEETPAGLDAYLRCFLDASGEERVLDLITRINGEVVADRRLVETIRSALSAVELRSQEDWPYASGDHIVGGVLMRQRRGLMIDIPKHWLSDDPDFVLGARAPDPHHVERIAGAIAEGVMRAI